MDKELKNGKYRKSENKGYATNFYAFMLQS